MRQSEKFDVVLVEIRDLVVIRHVDFGAIVKVDEFVRLQLI